MHYAARPSVRRSRQNLIKSLLASKVPDHRSWSWSMVAMVLLWELRIIAKRFPICASKRLMMKNKKGDPCVILIEQTCGTYVHWQVIHLCAQHSLHFLCGLCPEPWRLACFDFSLYLISGPVCNAVKFPCFYVFPMKLHWFLWNSCVSNRPSNSKLFNGRSVLSSECLWSFTFQTESYLNSNILNTSLV